METNRDNKLWLSDLVPYRGMLDYVGRNAGNETNITYIRGSSLLFYNLLLTTTLAFSPFIVANLESLIK